MRVNDRFQIEDPRFAQRLWVEVGLRELVFGGQEDENSDGLSEEERRERWYVAFLKPRGGLGRNGREGVADGKQGRRSSGLKSEYSDIPIYAWAVF